MDIEVRTQRPAAIRLIVGNSFCPAEMVHIGAKRKNGCEQKILHADPKLLNYAEIVDQTANHKPTKAFWGEVFVTTNNEGDYRGYRPIEQGYRKEMLPGPE